MKTASNFVLLLSLVVVVYAAPTINSNRESIAIVNIRQYSHFSL